MPKKLLKKYLLSADKVKQIKCIQIFGKLLHDPNIWHLNRYSTLRGVSCGLFIAFLPIPFQMVLAAIIAIAIRANLVVSMTFVWVTNPFTMAPIFFTAYKIGTILLKTPHHHFNFELSFSWLAANLAIVWKPLLLGCLVLATLSALIGNLIMRTLWRTLVIRNWKLRRKPSGTDSAIS